MKIFKDIVYLILFSPIFFIELINYKLFKINCSRLSHQYLIKLFMFSGGWSNDLIHNFTRKKLNFENEKFFLSNKKEFNNRINDLNNWGFYKEETFLTGESIDKILIKLKSLKGKYSGDKIADDNLYELNPNHKLRPARFTYETSDLLEIPEIQEILLSDKILKTANLYLKSIPIIDIVTAWWTFPTIETDKKAAQFWHFDMDRSKWLKVFIYLNDVNLDNGPHCFIKKSHLNNGIDFKIRKKGYNRLEDSIIDYHYSKNDIEYIFGKKGAILFEDTRGLHKGLRVKKDSRLLLQIQFSSSLFGGKLNPIQSPKNQIDKFQNMKKNNPIMFQAFE